MSTLSRPPREIDGKDKTVRELLAGRKYSIDYYQREYKWQQKQVAELIDDLAAKFLESHEEGNERSAVSEYGHYFLGSIIISDKDGQKFIIDGQQRLTTLTLLLIFLRHRLEDSEQKAQLAELIFSQKYGKRSFNLDISERTPCMEALYDGKEFSDAGASDSVLNILARYADIAEQFPEELADKALPYFVDWLIENVHLIEITAYKEKRAALITRAITKGLPPDDAAACGLDPHPKMKPSGIDWLGDVPEHWEVKRGRFCMDVNPRSRRLRALSPEDEVSFVPMEAVGEYGSLALEQTRAITDIGSGYTEFDDGDIVVAKITPCFENGKGALAEGLTNGAAFGTTELHILRAAATLERRFLFYFTISRLFRSAGEGEMYGAGGQKRVPTEFCENVRVPLPPMDYQRAIADFLDRETGKIDALIAKVETAIERLQEYRTALITAAVTGKIDIRGWIPR
ncbi:MAG: DUF262 domain-containing protein [Pseudomonadota bacterium]|jgi:hypothetical protein|nr:DUF262 domain-containing protein [Pseudomonadota bacterium]